MTIINLTQHNATAAQLSQGVFDPTPDLRDQIRELLTFSDLPGRAEIENRAAEIANIASLCQAERAMIGGAPYLMAPLESALQGEGIRPVYAFSRRESIETHDAQGRVIKRAVFVHRGFVEGKK